jgi:hypothetical protein
MREKYPGRPGTDGKSCKGPAASKKAVLITYDHGRVQNGYLFATHRDRALYIRANCSEEWLNEHPDDWVPAPKTDQETSSTRGRAETETPVQEIAAETTSPVPSPDTQNDTEIAGTADSGKIASNPCPPQKPVLDAERLTPSDTPNGPAAEREITIDGKRCVTAKRYAEMLGKSRKTLDRLCARGKAPPKVKIGRKVFFEVS